MEPLPHLDTTTPVHFGPPLAYNKTVDHQSPHTDEHAPVALWDIATLARRLGVSTRFVRRLVAERRIPFVKVGAYVRFEPDDVHQWLAARRVPPRT